MGLEIKKHKDKYEVNVFFRKGGGTSYHNFIDKDPKKLAIVLHDLECEGFPIRKAIKIFDSVESERDWLGL